MFNFQGEKGENAKYRKSSIIIIFADEEFNERFNINILLIFKNLSSPKNQKYK